MTETLKEVNVLKVRCKNLEEKNTILEQQVRNLKRQIRKNNVVFHNVTSSDNEDAYKKIKELCSEVNVTVPDYAINNCYRVGKTGDKRPIIVSFNNSQVKTEIMKKKEELKMKSHPVSHDRTPEDREEAKKVYNSVAKLKEIDPNASYRRGFFKFRGNYYRINEVDYLLNEQDKDTCMNPSDEQDAKKRKVDIANKLEQFQFRPRTPSAGSSRSMTS
ncbi:hypothetical protein O3M35_011896 [Rhynocoris fuscipes]|uniref:Uncharacterized protein n=1 Tax=Rhynocoris fuscipes TaxID=488301 RepID=A0AAW1D4M9_9HEMI